MYADSTCSHQHPTFRSTRLPPAVVIYYRRSVVLDLLQVKVCQGKHARAVVSVRVSMATTVAAPVLVLQVLVFLLLADQFDGLPNVDAAGAVAGRGRGGQVSAGHHVQIGDGGQGRVVASARRGRQIGVAGRAGNGHQPPDAHVVCV